MQENEIIENSMRVLRRLRLAGDITQTNIADALKLLPSGYNNLESGKRKLHLLDLIRIAAFYDINLSDLAEMIQQSPADLALIKKLQIELDAALKENTWLKQEIANKIKS